MEGKSATEERRIAHETKKGRTGREIPAPRGAENPARRQNFVSETPTIFHLCTAAKTRTARRRTSTTPDARTHQRKKGRMRPQKDGIFTPKQRARQQQQNFARGILSACIRPSQTTYLTEPTSRRNNNECQRTTILPAPPTRTGARFVRRSHRRQKGDFVRAKGKKKHNASDIFPLLKSENKKKRRAFSKKNS